MAPAQELEDGLKEAFAALTAERAKHEDPFKVWRNAGGNVGVV